MKRIDIRVELVERYRGKEYWYAYDDQRYDVDFDGEGYVANYACASGGSKWDAIRELINNLEEAER